jgi:hypothetical protein
MSTQAWASSGSTKLNASAPNPFRAATLMVSRFVHAIHIEGCIIAGFNWRQLLALLNLLVSYKSIHFRSHLIQ